MAWGVIARPKRPLPDEVRVFEFTDRDLIREADPDPAVLGEAGIAWRVLVGRDRKPIGVRLTIAHAGSAQGEPGAQVTLSALLDCVLAGLTTEVDEQPVFPHGLIVLSPGDFELNEAMQGWRAPRNVLLEFGLDDLRDDRWLNMMFEVRKQGVRMALRVDGPDAVPPERLPYFQYLVAPSRQAVPQTVDPANVSILTLEASDHAQIDADFSSGVHATAGWPLQAPNRREPGGPTPTQTAVFELIRLVQADAGVSALERVFRGEPRLAYLLLTLANSAALRRAGPVSSIGHAISLLGYQRLVKWLVLLLAIADKDEGTAPLVYVAVARGHLLENLLAAARRPRSERDDAFIVGTFSLLDSITGQRLADLLRDAHLPASIAEALLADSGPYASLLQIAREFEAPDPRLLPRIQAEQGIEPAEANRALLRAIASADSLQSLI